MITLSHAWLFATAWTVACTKLLRPWDFPGKGTGVGCHFLLQGIYLTQGLNLGLPHCRQMLLPSEPTWAQIPSSVSKLWSTKPHDSELLVVLLVDKMELCTDLTLKTRSPGVNRNKHPQSFPMHLKIWKHLPETNPKASVIFFSEMWIRSVSLTKVGEDKAPQHLWDCFEWSKHQRDGSCWYQSQSLGGRALAF